MSLSPHELAERLDAARAGCRDALGKALDECRAYLLQIARDELGPGLEAKGGASDLVQDTFLQAQRSFPGFEGRSDRELRAWLRCLLLHQAARLGRRFRSSRKRRLAREVRLGDLPPPDPDAGGLLATGPTPSGQVMLDEQMNGIHEAIDRLPDDYRRVMVLRYQRELTFEQIGELLGRSADAVRMLWARALERMKHELRTGREAS